MAGHSRTTATGATRPGVTGKPRRVREHLPAGDAEHIRRAKSQRGAKTRLKHRLDRTSDPLARLDAARDYLRSAAAKYQTTASVEQAVQALIVAADRIFRDGDPLTEAQHRTRRDRAARRKQHRDTTAVLLREGRAAVRRQQANASDTGR